MALLIVVACPVIASIAGGEGKPNYAVGVYRAEKKPFFVCFAKQEPSRARQNFLATTYKDFFSSLYLEREVWLTRTLGRF